MINSNYKAKQRKIGKLNINPYHKDNFEYDYELDAFKCPENEYMYFQAKYIEPHKHPKNQTK